MNYVTLRQAAKKTGMSYTLLLEMHKAGLLPGFMSKSRFYTDVEKLPAVFADMAERRVNVQEVKAGATVTA